MISKPFFSVSTFGSYFTLPLEGAIGELQNIEGGFVPFVQNVMMDKRPSMVTLRETTHVEITHTDTPPSPVNSGANRCRFSVKAFYVH